MPKEKKKKPDPPLSGLSIVASLWLWGAILFFVPYYFDINGGWQIPFNILGVIILAISFGGALMEFSKHWKSEALSYWGAGLVFLVPSITLFVFVHLSNSSSVWIVLSKIGALLLLAIGAPFIFMGIPYLFWRDEQEAKLEELLAEDLSDEEKIEKQVSRQEARFSSIASIIIALLSLTTAIVKLMFEIIRR